MTGKGTIVGTPEARAIVRKGDYSLTLEVAAQVFAEHQADWWTEIQDFCAGVPGVDPDEVAMLVAAAAAAA